MFLKVFNKSNKMTIAKNELRKLNFLIILLLTNTV